MNFYNLRDKSLGIHSALSYDGYYEMENLGVLEALIST